MSASWFVSDLSCQRVDCQRVGLSARCLSPEIWADTAKFTNVIVAEFRKCRRMCSSKIKPRLRAEWVVVREESCILESCCLSPIR